MADLALTRPRARFQTIRGRLLARPGAARPYLYLAPFFLVLVAFTFWPLLQTLVLSFQAWNLNPDVPARFVALDNYRGVTSSSLFGAALFNTALYLLAAMPLKVILPIPVAIFIWSL